MILGTGDNNSEEEKNHKEIKNTYILCLLATGAEEKKNRIGKWKFSCWGRLKQTRSENFLSRRG